MYYIVQWLSTGPFNSWYDLDKFIRIDKARSKVKAYLKERPTNIFRIVKTIK